MRLFLRDFQTLCSVGLRRKNMKGHDGQARFLVQGRTTDDDQKETHLLFVQFLLIVFRQGLDCIRIFWGFTRGILTRWTFCTRRWFRCRTFFQAFRRCWWSWTRRSRILASMIRCVDDIDVCQVSHRCRQSFLKVNPGSINLGNQLSSFSRSNGHDFDSFLNPFSFSFELF